MSRGPTLFVILAAGKGTRMISDTPKVLHRIGGRSLLGHVLALASGDTGGSGQHLAVIVAPGMAAVEAEAKKQAAGASIFVQQEQRGTAHAVLAARDALEGHSGDVFILYGDTPLIRRETVERMRTELGRGAHAAVLGFEPENPTGYGRLLLNEEGRLAAIREESDATSAERKIRLCNSGVFAFRVPNLAHLLNRIESGNAKGEYYLTDIVGILRKEGLETVVVRADAEEVMGVNSRAELAAAEGIFQKRARARALMEGATLIAPETVWFSFDTVLGHDVLIEPNVFFGPGVVVEDGVHILANCHMEGARLRKGARVGPFARLRPGTDIGPGVHIGNFVEVKNTVLEEGAKANHLAYLGDGHVGARANIGAGTIFCNYDGFFKHRTEVGEGAFVGSNTSLVAPVTVGAGAYIGSGSVITRNVAPEALALERTGQAEHPGWAAKFRALMARRKAQAV